MNDLIQIFTNPRGVFQRQEEDEASWLLPALVILVFSIASAIAVSQATDLEAATTEALEQQFKMMEEQGTPPEVIEQTRAQMESAVGAVQSPIAVFGFAALGVVLVFSVVVLIHALYFLIVGKIMRVDLSFVDWLALSCWGRMPMVIGAIVLIIATLTMSTQTDPNNFNLLAFANWVSLPNMDHMFLGDSVRSLDVFVIWSIVIMTIGFQQWTEKSLGVSAAVVAVPYVLIYGALLAY